MRSKNIVALAVELRICMVISRFEWVVCIGARLVLGSDFVLGLKVSVRTVNKKPRTRN